MKLSNMKYDTMELAERYDRISDSQFERGSRLLEMMGVKKGNVVLDVGCGTGRLAIHASGVVGASGRIFGLDPSMYRVRVAKDKLKGLTNDNVSLSQGRAEDLGLFQDGVFDHVYYSSVFHWVEDKSTALKEAYRVLKPGGKIGMTTGDRNNQAGLRALTDKVIARPPYKGHVRAEDDASKRVTRGELEGLLSAARFSDVRVTVQEKKRYYSSPNEAFEFSEASSFGNSLMHIPEGLRAQAMKDIAVELEKMMTAAGIELSSTGMFVIAVKHSSTNNGSFQ
jgi:ubiquinone/menaquinone biosynthesis C-methylase UbiE